MYRMAKLFGVAYLLMPEALTYTRESCFDRKKSHIIELKSNDLAHIVIIEHIRDVSFDDDKNMCFSINLSADGFSELHYFSPVPKDLTCLLAAPYEPDRTHAIFKGNFDALAILGFINKMSAKYQLLNGSLSSSGRWVREMTANLHVIKPNEVCQHISANNLDIDAFKESFWYKQRPVVIDDFISLTNMSLIRILMNHLDERVGVKFSPSRDFEGIDFLQNWEMSLTQKVPPHVMSRLQSPDKVVVRAVHKEMLLSEFLSLIVPRSTPSLEDCDELHAYIEYLPLKTHLEGFLESVLMCPRPSPTILDVFKNGQAHLWLGDGNTIGKLHFDPFDNILVQLEGEKTFRMIDVSNNTRMKEGHMREAQLEVSANESTKYCRFSRRKLMESTSMVHSSILFENGSADGILSMTCTVKPGQALFVPSYWWHEVTSSPGPANFYLDDERLHLNAAINYWFEPLFKKEFPCEGCHKIYNEAYRNECIN